MFISYFAHILCLVHPFHRLSLMYEQQTLSKLLGVIIGVVLSVQCVASFIQACKKKPIITEEVTSSKVLVAMPCYNEGLWVLQLPLIDTFSSWSNTHHSIYIYSKELNKTIKSVTDTTYPDDNKCLIAIADGQITGKGEPASTPQILGRIWIWERRSWITQCFPQVYKCRNYHRELCPVTLWNISQRSQVSSNREGWNEWRTRLTKSWEQGQTRLSCYHDGSTKSSTLWKETPTVGCCHNRCSWLSTNLHRWLQVSLGNWCWYSY